MLCSINWIETRDIAVGIEYIVLVEEISLCHMLTGTGTV